MSPRVSGSNGRAPGSAADARALRAGLPAVLAALRAAARTNLVALLADRPPVPLDRAALAGLFAGGPGAVAGPKPGLAEVGQAVAARVLADPASLPGLFDPDAGFGAEVLLPLVLGQAFSDGALRHDLAEICRLFLCERVLFHPGPPPQALFTPGGVALLVASQTRHGLALGADFARLRAAAADLRGPDRPLSAWDEWLLRRMDAAADWLVPQGLETLPWVVWRGEAGVAADPALPACWASLLDLTP